MFIDRQVVYGRVVQSGVTLIETIVFMVVVSIALVALLYAYNQSVVNSVDPITRVKALERAQGMMDRVLTRKFDENTPTGGSPACSSTGAPACAGIVPEGDYDDVGDFHNYMDSSDADYPLAIEVVEAGSDLGLSNAQARRITVVVGMPSGDSLTISAYKVNY